MTTTSAAEAIFDPIMRLTIRLTAVAKPRDPDAFERLLSEFAVAIVREAFENQDEIRLLLNMPRRVYRTSDVDDADACSYCREPLVDGREHCCAGAVVPTKCPCGILIADGPGLKNPVRCELPLGHEGLHSGWGETSTGEAAVETLGSCSMGAAEAEPKADIRVDESDAASVTLPAAPSHAYTCGECRRTDGAHETWCGPGSAAAPETPWAASSSTSRRLTPDQLAKLRADYDAAINADGMLPNGWVTAQAKALGFSYPAIKSRVEAFALEDEQRERDRVDPNEKGLAGEAHDEHIDDARAHTHTHSPECWCRTSLPGEEWCALKREPAPNSSALSDSQRKQVVELYRAARPKGAPLPSGWIAARAEEWGVPYHAVYSAIAATKAELDQLAKRSTEPAAAPPRAHLNSERCWCRLQPSSLKNQHCQALDKKPRDRLVEPPRRVTRVLGTRY